MGCTISYTGVYFSRNTKQGTSVSMQDFKITFQMILNRIGRTIHFSGTGINCCKSPAHILSLSTSVRNLPAFPRQNQSCVIPLVRTERYETLWKEACQRISQSVLLFHNIRSSSLSTLSLVSWLWLRWWEKMEIKAWNAGTGDSGKAGKRLGAWSQLAPPPSRTSCLSKP